MQLKALIVDDEYPAREEIRYHLKKYDNIQVVGEATNITEALTLINALDYDLVFLDINFPGMNGIDLGRELQKKEKSPKVVYVTAYDEYALDAFEVNAVAYILKPIDEERFDRTINRILKIFDRLPAKNQGAEIVNHAKNPPDPHMHSLNKITAELNGKTFLVDIDEICFAYNEHNYVFIKRENDRLITKYTLTYLEEKLSNKNYFRASRGYLVNLNKVMEISPFFNGSYCLVMSDREHTNIQVSRRQSKELRKIFDL